jgi:hypothetical protein
MYGGAPPNGIPELRGDELFRQAEQAGNEHSSASGVVALAFIASRNTRTVSACHEKLVIVESLTPVEATGRNRRSPATLIGQLSPKLLDIVGSWPASAENQ